MARSGIRSERPRIIRMASEQEEELETLMSIYGDKITVITQGKEYIVSWIFEQIDLG